MKSKTVVRPFNMKPSFEWATLCELQVEGYSQAVLSVPALSSKGLLEKDLLSTGPGGTYGRAALAGHLNLLRQQNAVRPDVPLLVLGIRNNLVNLRAPIIWKGQAYAVEGEKPEQSRRPYYGIGSRNGKLVVGQALGGSLEVWPQFFIAGVPVLWDDVDGEDLLDLMLVEAADHSHVYDLPRGDHPNATDTSRQNWSRLHSVFKANVHSDFPTAAFAMRSAIAAVSQPIPRSDNYLNAVVGVKRDGTLLCIYAHGRLESLGKRAKALGCQRAVCVENSGSVMPTYLPNGLNGDQVPLLRAPNFRQHGRALLVLELKNKVFSSSSVLEEDP